VGKLTGTFLSDECELNCSRLNLFSRHPRSYVEFPRSKLSTHAVERLNERFNINSDEFLYLLNSGQGKKIGKSIQTHLAHRLLWSHKDEQLLVAIQDVVDGVVLTVLTLEMYCRDYEHNITDRRISGVINKMVHSAMAPSSLWHPGVPDEHVTVYTTILDSPSVVALGRWKGAVDSVQLSELGKKPEFWSWVSTQVSTKGYSVERVLSVEAKFTGGDAQGVPYACPLLSG